MTDTTERAELLDLADRIDVHVKYGTSAIFEQDDAKKVASALRRLAAQDQKPVAFRWRVSHLKPWKYCSSDYMLSPDVVADSLYLSPPPAAAETNASAEARLREALDAISHAEGMLSKHIEEFHDFDYLPGDEPREVAQLRGIQHHLLGSLINEKGEPLSAHSHASVCDKQGETTYLSRPVCRCFDDRSRELCLQKDKCRPVAKAFAVDVSDRPADVTVELKPFEWSKINAYEACNGTLWRTAEEATVESRRARDAFTVGRR